MGAPSVTADSVKVYASLILPGPVRPDGTLRIFVTGIVADTELVEY